MAKYEQICGKRTQKSNTYAKYCKKKAVRAANKRIVLAHIKGDTERALKDIMPHKIMSGYIH